jgi:secreted protein with Ig-like and vWFA domain
MNSKYDGAGLKEQPRLRMNVVIVLDVSGSMASITTREFSRTKLEMAKDAITLIVKQLKPSDRFSLITYADTSQTCVPLTMRRDMKDEAVRFDYYYYYSLHTSIIIITI